jgi:putative DNA primase/helicase
VLAATGEYFADQDLFGSWMAERVERSPEYSAAAADLYRSWQTFCEAAGEKPGTSKQLGARLRRVGLVSQPQRIDGRVQRAWQGLRLRSGGVPNA